MPLAERRRRELLKACRSSGQASKNGCWSVPKNQFLKRKVSFRGFRDIPALCIRRKIYMDKFIGYIHLQEFSRISLGV